MIQKLAECFNAFRFLYKTAISFAPIFLILHTEGLENCPVNSLSPHENLFYTPPPETLHLQEHHLWAYHMEQDSWSYDRN